MAYRQLKNIRIRDPFILPVQEEKRYYMVGTTGGSGGGGTGFRYYTSSDLLVWDGPFDAYDPGPEGQGQKDFWAPELFRYGGNYYMFATFGPRDSTRRCQVLKSDNPGGPYRPWSDGPITPTECGCLDATLYFEDGTPWTVFCREWVDVGDGEICARRLTDDLRSATGSSVLLFRATDCPTVANVAPDGAQPGYVTDGPFLHRTESGELFMLWSSCCRQPDSSPAYTMLAARSETGKIRGPWLQLDKPLYTRDGGHSMLSRDFYGGLHAVFHSPNSMTEHAVIASLRIHEGVPVLEL